MSDIATATASSPTPTEQRHLTVPTERAPEMQRRVQEDVARIMAAITPRRTWTFTNRETGQATTVTCLPGCVLDHSRDIATPTHASDVYCRTEGDDSAATVPIDFNTGTPEAAQILTVWIESDPFSTDIARRLPHAVVEIIDEHYIAPLDPDALAELIALLTQRVAALRMAHLQLVGTRAAVTALPEASA
ncbi:DUF6907 domain-containing protein [Streptomyces sp. NPDC014776]|uniref:DUF6907 domain-containing protein n=1 Tax=Streptomyces sp. NPDC014776 TaxID=3364909 RepID=UPI0037012957